MKGIKGEKWRKWRLEKASVRVVRFTKHGKWLQVCNGLQRGKERGQNLNRRVLIWENSQKLGLALDGKKNEAKHWCFVFGLFVIHIYSVFKAVFELRKAQLLYFNYLHPWTAGRLSVEWGGYTLNKQLEMSQKGEKDVSLLTLGVLAS